MNESHALALTLAVDIMKYGASPSGSVIGDAEVLLAFLTKDDVAVNPVDAAPEDNYPKDSAHNLAAEILRRADIHASHARYPAHNCFMYHPPGGGGY